MCRKYPNHRSWSRNTEEKTNEGKHNTFKQRRLTEEKKTFIHGKTIEKCPIQNMIEVNLMCVYKNEMSRDTTKTTKWVCAQRRLRSAWESAQSIGPLAIHWAQSEDSDQTGRMHILFFGFVMSRLKYCYMWKWIQLNFHLKGRYQKSLCYLKSLDS